VNELHYMLPQDHQPVDFHRWAQEEIAWGFRDAPAEMSTPSNMAAVVSAIEGASGSTADEELRGVETRIDAAERFRHFARTLIAIGPVQTSILRKVYEDPLAETDLIAFGGAANLFLESPVAHQAYKRTRTTMGFITWAGELRVKLAGERYEDARVAGRYLRRPPRASEGEKAAAEEIKRALEKTLTGALSDYAMARPRRGR
jgi:hypothetical protein